jgi:GeoRSP system SPASM domain protein
MKFDLPWRIHWRPGSQASPVIVSAIRKANPLAVTAHVEGVEELAATGLPWDGCALVVILGGWREHADFQATLLQPLAVNRYEFPIDDPDEAAVLAQNGFMGVDPAMVALRWYPVRGRFDHLVPILEIAARHGCSVTLPNRPAGVITSVGVETFPEPSELDAVLAETVKAAASGLVPGRIRVHDFILARILEQESTEPSGCEAGNAIVFIDESGTVYPCETLLVPMGNLENEELDTIWASPLRDRIRADVGKMPGLCASCPELTICRGGCRGAVYHLKGHYSAPDPMCPL